MDQQVKMRALAALLEEPLPVSGNKTFRCLRPEHDDRNPSMSVSSAGLVRCHGCGLSGDAISVVAAIRGLNPKADYKKVEQIVLQLAENSDAVHLKRPKPDRGAEVLRKHSVPGPQLTTTERVKCEALAISYLEIERGLDYQRCVELGARPLNEKGGGVAFGIGPMGQDRQAESIRHLQEEHRRYTTRGSPKGLSPFTTWNPTNGDPDVVVIVEGILDAIAADAVGMCALALSFGTSGVRGAKPELARLNALGVSFIIAMDGDDSGESAADELVAMLDEMGANAAKRMQFPALAKDMNALYLMLGPVGVKDWFDALLDEVTLPRSPAAWLDPADWSTMKSAEVEWVVDGNVSRGDRVIIVGPGESLKTMWACGVALACTRPAGSKTKVGAHIVLGGHDVLFLGSPDVPVGA